MTVTSTEAEPPLPDRVSPLGSVQWTVCCGLPLAVQMVPAGALPKLTKVSPTGNTSSKATPFAGPSPTLVTVIV